MEVLARLVGTNRWRLPCFLLVQRCRKLLDVVEEYMLDSDEEARLSEMFAKSVDGARWGICHEYATMRICGHGEDCKFLHFERRLR